MRLLERLGIPENGLEQGVREAEKHMAYPGNSGTPWCVEKVRWRGREQGWKGKQRRFSERP